MDARVAHLEAELRALADGDPGQQNGRVPEGVEHLTDLGNARRLVSQHGERLRYCHAWGSWLIEQDGRFRRDDTGAVERLAKETVRSIYREAAQTPDSAARKALAKHAEQSESEARIAAMVKLTRSEPNVSVRPADLDADPFLLSCANGTLDLRTGELREADPNDLLTLGTDIAYDPAARCNRWLRFLDEVFASDEELIEFVRRGTGYSLTGDTREHVLFVCHGAGCNGKTTLIEVGKRLGGEYGVTASFDTCTRSRNSGGPREDLARLHRARLVVAAESGEGRQLDEATVKLMTGGDTVSARFLYQQHFEFRPAFKLWLVTNHRPRVDGDDDAIWRRLKLIPFEKSFEGREDRTLAATLEAELPGILAWAVQGCLAWQRDGLGTAQAVVNATKEYRQDEDMLGAFLSERCTLSGEVATADFRTGYENFCKDVGEKPLAANVLGKRLAKRGITRGGHGRGFYLGVSLG
jgi:putative DNA primase/helicase